MDSDDCVKIGHILHCASIQMKRKVRIAFQGGGAKLISLIAAADAVKSLDSEIEVEAVSGSSAGAIVAILYSLGANFGDVKRALKRNEETISKKFKKPGKMRFFWRGLVFAVCGRPLFGVDQFNKIVKSVFNECKINTNDSLEGDKRIPVYVTISDIYKGESITRSTGSIRDAIQQSCAIPFVFCTHKNDSEGQYADGGIFDNLPTDALIKHGSSDIPVFAVGFPNETQSSAPSALKYMLSIITSVIANRVSNSRAAIGPDNVFEIATKLNTLDFDKIVSVGIDEEYDLIRDQAIAFFRKWLANGSSSVITSGHIAGIRLSNTESKLIKNAEDAFKSISGHHDYVRYVVKANCLHNNSVADEIRLEQLMVIPEGKVLPSLILPLVSGSGSISSIESRVCLDGPDGPDLKYQSFLTSDEVEIRGKKVPRNSLVILFTGDISAMSGKKIYVLKKESRYGFMAPLSSGSDFLAISAQYWPAKEILIRFDTPIEVAPSWHSESTPAVVTPSLVPPNLLPTNWYGYQARMENVDHNGSLKGTFTPR